VILNQADFSSLLESKSFLGNTLALMSTIAWAIYTIMSKKRVNKFKPVVVTTIASIFGSLSLLISMLIFEGVPKFSSYSVSTYMLLAYLGVVATALCLFTWNYALERLDASKVGIYMFLMPIIAIIIGVLLFQEKLTLQIITGAILVFSGIYFTEKKEQGT
jgi:drug/metabolite transporter (DMT)-like permease